MLTGSTANESMASGMQDSSDKRNDEEVEDLEWSADQEILLLYSLHGYKPVGPDKHFRMLVIQRRLSNAMNKNISSKAIWKKLNTLYDLEALDEAEAEADAMVAVETDFVLPEDEYGELIAEKLKKNVTKFEKQDFDSENSDTQGLEMLSEFKTDLESSSIDNEGDNSRDAGEAKAGSVKDRKETPKRGFKRKETTAAKDLPLKRDSAKETPKKDTPGKKEVAKDAKKGMAKEEEKKDLSKKSAQDVSKSTKETKDNKEEKKESPVKGNKGTDKKTEQTKKDVEAKKTEQKKVGESPKNQRAEAAKPRAETPKQLRTETPKRTEAKTLRSETPKPQRVEALKKESSVEKKKEVVDKKLERKSPEKTPDNIRGAKLRTREKKDLEPEKPETPTGTKRERSRDSTSKATDTTPEEPPPKKTKTSVAKGRPTRNSVDPQQKATPTPAVNSAPPQKRRRGL